MHADQPFIESADEREIRPSRARVQFDDEADFDFLDQLQEDATLALLRADRGPRRKLCQEDAFWA